MTKSQEKKEHKKFEEWKKHMYEVIRICREKYPDQFLTIEFIRISPTNELIPIGLFKCMSCNSIITHAQFNFARVCGACDVGRKMPKWKIEKPVEYAPWQPFKSKLKILKDFEEGKISLSGTGFLFDIRQLLIKWGKEIKDRRRMIKAGAPVPTDPKKTLFKTEDFIEHFLKEDLK